MPQMWKGVSLGEMQYSPHTKSPILPWKSIAKRRTITKNNTISQFRKDQKPTQKKLQSSSLYKKREEAF